MRVLRTGTPINPFHDARLARDSHACSANLSNSPGFVRHAPHVLDSSGVMKIMHFIHSAHDTGIEGGEAASNHHA